jgi:hypothetical protein
MLVNVRLVNVRLVNVRHGYTRFGDLTMRSLFLYPLHAIFIAYLPSLSNL